MAGGDTDGNARLNLGVHLAAFGDHSEASKIFGSETRPGCVIEGVVHALRTLRDPLPGQAEEIDALIGTLREVT
ncbi:hypothetical protein [Nonomuraea cavernae]|uniref:Uncharacterized protein n=1 Tax=Nonomuraea cavernae TaxID=2045107 RepID=A0A918DQ65_9ACTN|nr:hypothetical protein [Nonomuraea cavernae]MCA2190439.1 hypothetical protein [Nonomuraea cavernae]GGO79635.1 hypothetical protein GCM10012289_64380 [Nonomuraea cavernae]